MSGLFIHNPVHTIGSMISFISIVVGYFVFAKRFSRDPRWKGWATYSIASGILMMIFLYLLEFPTSARLNFCGINLLKK
jgi:hypothetical protein